MSKNAKLFKDIFTGARTVPVFFFFFSITVINA